MAQSQTVGKAVAGKNRIAPSPLTNRGQNLLLQALPAEPPFAWLGVALIEYANEGLGGYKALFVLQTVDRTSYEPNIQ